MSTNYVVQPKVEVLEGVEGNGTLENAGENGNEQETNVTPPPGPSTPNPENFSDFEAFLMTQEEESKFQKHGKRIYEMLDREFRQMHKGVAGSTRLHDYQIEAVMKTAKHFSSTSADVEREEESLPPPALICAPPGSGKSGIVTLIPYAVLSKKVLIVTPSKVISDQIADAFGFPNLNSAFFLKCGMFQALKPVKTVLEVPHIARNPEEVNRMTFHNLVIVNAQKFGGNSSNSLTSKKPGVVDEMYEKLREFDTIIVDEAHHYPAQTWNNIIEGFKAHGKKIVFLTATPFRGYNNRIVHITTLSHVKEVFCVPRGSLEGKTIRKIEFVEKAFTGSSISEEFAQQLRTDIQDILDQHKRMEPRLETPQAIIVVRKKNEAKELAQLLGAKATFVVSGKDGIKNLADFTNAYKEIAVVCGMLREGYDNPNVTLCVILLNCQSRVFFEQFCGRCMRMNRNLTGKWADKTVGTVLSYEAFQQKKMWDAREFIANEDPCEEHEGDDNDILDLSINNPA